ncbi:MAG: HAD-IB family hydrolase [Patescibacteria group bacterium]|nr:HAD-IB family hydrolase [Patescibacteria group bacterium]
MKKTKLAIFDIDGTLFRKNLHFELIDELAYRGIFKKEVRNELVHAYGHWLDNEGTYESYRKKLVSLYGRHIKGCNQKDILSAAKNVASFNAKRVYMYAKDLFEELRGSHVMLIISGSPIEIVTEYANIFKFDAYYGSVYEIDKNEKYTGRPIFEPTKDKGAVVEQFIAENRISLQGSIGIGDTESDAKFLELVDRPIAFNPNLNLKKIAEKRGWEIKVEKKDVLYEIKPEKLSK